MLLGFATALILLLPGATPVAAQNNDQGKSNVIEDTFDDSYGYDEPAIDDVAEELERRAGRPIELHTTTATELARLPGISLPTALRVLDAVDAGHATTMAAIDSLAGLTAEEVAILEAFTVLTDRTRNAERRLPEIEIRARVLRDLQTRAGYRNPLLRVLQQPDSASPKRVRPDTIAIGSAYLGTPEAVLVSAEATWPNFALEAAFEKDAGEAILAHDTLGYRYQALESVRADSLPTLAQARLAAFVSASFTATIGNTHLVLGDYRATFGQGLVLWLGREGAKGTDVLAAPRKNGGGIRGYSGADEANFLRGAAIVHDRRDRWGNGWDAEAFVSHRYHDAASLSATDSDNTVVVQSLRDNSYRRTRSELRHSATVIETLIGGHAGITRRAWSLGLTGYESAIVTTVDSGLQSPATTSRAAMLGAHGHASLPSGELFGELAWSSSRTIGGLGGFHTALGAIRIVLAVRWLPPDFITLHGSGFGESPTAQRNERGLYLGFNTRLTTGLSVRGYADLFHVPAPTPTMPIPYHGSDGLLRVEYQPMPNCTVTMQARSRTKPEVRRPADSLDRDRRRITPRTATTGRLEARYRPNGGRWELRARLDRSHVAYDAIEPSANGFGTSVAIAWHPTAALAFGARVALFDTDADAPLFATEYELPGRLRTVAMAGLGQHILVTARWRVSDHVSLAGVFGATAYSDRYRISPGTTQQIDGAVGSWCGLQASARW